MNLSVKKKYKSNREDSRIKINKITNSILSNPDLTKRLNEADSVRTRRLYLENYFLIHMEDLDLSFEDYENTHFVRKLFNRMQNLTGEDYGMNNNPKLCYH